jgi:hypothetical protein
MALSMQRGTAAFLVAEQELGVRSDLHTSNLELKVILANPNHDVDWDQLMVETEAEWSQTLEYLGR